MKRVTLDDIAKKMHISKGLVSRALTGKYNVSETMRNEITRTAVAMGYDFAKLRTKANKRSKFLLVMSIEMISNEDYWQPIIKGITATLDEAHINLEYHIYKAESISQEDVDKLKSANVSGYILMHNNPEIILAAVESTNRPVVVIDPKTVQVGNHLQIKYNNFDSTYALTKLLIQNGHRHICYYGARDWSSSFMERENGFRACIQDFLECGAHKYICVFSNASKQFADNEMFEKMLLENPQITAVVCANDIVAGNAKKSIERLGKRVPEDISLVGFDDIRESREDMMNLTTVNVPRTALGVETARYLINHITNKQIWYSQIIIQCKLIIRNSIKNIK